MKYFAEKGRVQLLLLFIGLGLVLAMNLDPRVCAAEEETACPETAKGREAYLQARQMFYSSSGSLEATYARLTEAEEYFRRLPEGSAQARAEKYYWQGMVCFLWAEVAEAEGSKREAARKFTESSELAQKALDAQGEFGEACRLLADAYQRLMNYNGMLFAMGKSSTVKKLLEKALAQDGQNYQAYISLGTYYLFAPAIGGGSVERAISLFHKGLESEDEFYDFSANIWLGAAYEKKQDFATARQFYQKALEIYPNSRWAQSSLQGVTGK
jgi:tetratricopeptide (TPR) repeat protein